jgi:hypothetical protein
MRHTSNAFKFPVAQMIAKSQPQQGLIFNNQYLGKLCATHLANHKILCVMQMFYQRMALIIVHTKMLPKIKSRCTPPRGNVHLQ